MFSLSLLAKPRIKKQAFFIAKNDQYPIAATFARTSPSDALFVYATAKIGVVQLMLHLSRRFHYQWHH